MYWTQTVMFIRRGKTWSESLWGARCIFSNCVRDLSVALRFVCVVLSRSAAQQKDRRSFAFLQTLVNTTLSSRAEKKGPVDVPCDGHVVHVPWMARVRMPVTETSRHLPKAETDGYTRRPSILLFRDSQILIIVGWQHEGCWCHMTMGFLEIFVTILVFLWTGWRLDTELNTVVLLVIIHRRCEIVSCRNLKSPLRRRQQLWLDCWHHVPSPALGAALLYLQRKYDVSKGDGWAGNYDGHFHMLSLEVR